MPSTTNESQVCVIGAGIIGATTALRLQIDGYRVTLIDSNEPGAGCSAGNAGHFATELVYPLASFATLKSAVRMFFRPNSPLRIRLRYLPAFMGWALRFLRAAMPRKFRANTKALAELNGRALPAWKRLLTAMENEEAVALCKFGGSLLAFEREAALSHFEQGREQLETHGVRLELLSSKEIATRTGLAEKDVVGGVFFPDTGHCEDPKALVQTLVDGFTQRGGRVFQQRVTSIVADSRSASLSLADGQTLNTKRVVIAAGVASKALVESLGVTCPLEAEWGYHFHLEQAQGRHSLRVPLTLEERGFIMTPMKQALRLAGSVEFAGVDANPDWRRAEMLEHQATQAMPDLQCCQGTAWRGARPTLPDYLPAVGALTSNGRVLAAYGHQHLGLTLAAVTAELIATFFSSAADVQSGLESESALLLNAVAPDRFGRSQHKR